MDNNQLREIMHEYMSTPALAGYEKHMAHLFKEKITPYCDEVRIDRIGNVIGTIFGTDPESPKVMIYAHMDNIGWFVTHITPDGYLVLERNGSPQEKVIAGTTVVVETENGDYINGCFGTKPAELMNEADRTSVTPLAKLQVDIGVNSEEEAHELGVYIGCPVMYTPHCDDLQGTRITGSFCDNRGGCGGVTVAAEYLSKHKPKSTVYIVGTVWEEFNLRGGMMANRSIHTDISIGLDGPGSAFTPDKPYPEDFYVPGISMFTFHGRGTLNGCIPHKGVFELAKKVADEMGITPYRHAARGGLSDSSYLQLEDEGVAAIDLWTPGHYSHSYNEVLDVDGVRITGELAARMALSIDKNFPLGRLD